ncbi:MAG: transposase [Chlorogloeopsis fritschii C42_A2020_084]|uniref:REP-associated tyrosine transposase n=1 Tax=Chlorogloeopsis fritschii TaxID=1124 RepID=UPI0019F8B299|nr:transposase [Chlorogloeopsis fritschii]MBF2009306.1 transposase [Chlorogloeopsis fritschii C42_A2020_084]
MYEYRKLRKLTPEQKAELVKERLSKGYPPHSPPHPVKDKSFYLLTAACYEHKHHMHSESRRQQLLNMIFDKFGSNENEESSAKALTTNLTTSRNEESSAEALTTNVTICAWVILPNHYHLLVHVVNFDVLSELFRRIHGFTARQWNVEKNVTKRKIWYRWSDRAIRSERHYYTTLNYIHYNPVKHGFVKSPYDWVESSVHWYLQAQGRQWLRDCWVQHPVQGYGSDWDNF